MNKVYQKLSRTAEAYHNCIKTNNEKWQGQHLSTINEVVANYLPSGSGIDSGCTIDHNQSNAAKLLIYSSYHAMNDNGMYDGRIDFTVTVKASLAHNIDLTIKGNFGKHQELKGYLYQIFDEALTADIA